MDGDNVAYQVSLGTERYEWPYKVDYDAVNRVRTDVLVIGGGLAGCCAGIAAARRGLKVAIVDKAPIKRSGCGGAGMDHWNGCMSNPRSPITPEEYMNLPSKKHGLGYTEYIFQKGSYEALMEIEKMGMPIRDVDGDFAGAGTLDEETKLFKGFDYKNFVNVKLRGGHYIKPILFENARKEGAELYERIMVTNLLTEDGKQGGRVIGAMGVSMETGEFYVFEAKSVVMSSGYIGSIWIYSTELTGHSFHWDPNDVGDGFAMAWKAGAKATGMFNNGSDRGAHPFAWPRFGVGNPDNTWFPCTIVDNNGKEIPWEDKDGNPVTTIEARNLPVEGQPYIGSNFGRPMGIQKPLLIHDLPERIKNGEYELPLWADLSSMPEKERRSIWGLMVGNEGKTRYTLYDYYTRLGFDPDRDMLWVPVMSPDSYGGRNMDWFQGESKIVKPWRTESFGGQGCLLVDWNLKTSLEGLYAAGASGGFGSCAMACSSGFYAGNRCAEYAMKAEHVAPLEAQIEAERERVYAPVRREKDPKAVISWKELWGGTARVMQVCCNEYLTEPILKEGLDWMASIREQEMQMTYARNPHELVRVLECETRATVSEAYMRVCIAKLQADKQGLRRDQFLFNHMEGDEVISEIREDEFWLKPPYAPTYLENYQRCRAGEGENYHG